MASCRVSWILVVSYVALLALSTSGIALSLILTKLHWPEPPEIDITARNPDSQGAISSHHDHGDGHHTRELLWNYERETVRCADYAFDLRLYLIVPCGINILVTLPLIFGGLLSKEFFSTSIGLHSSMVLFCLNLGGGVLFQQYYGHYTADQDFSSLVLTIAMQIGILVVITFQVVLTIWEQLRQNINWLAFHVSEVFSLATVFLTFRTAYGICLIINYINSDFYKGFADLYYAKVYSSYDMWHIPKTKYPEFLAYPMGIALVYGVIVSSASLLSHLFGHVHSKMLLFTTLMSALLYGGMTVATSPAFMRMALSATAVPVVMNWALELMVLCMIHALVFMLRPSTLQPHPDLYTLLSQRAWPYLKDTCDGIMNRMDKMTCKSRMNKSLVFSFIIMGLSIAALVLTVHKNYPPPVGAHVIMICGNAVVLSRVFPSFVMQLLTGNTESMSLLKKLMIVFAECSLLLVGAYGSKRDYSSYLQTAVIINFSLVMLLICDALRYPVLRTLATNLPEQETIHSDAAQLISETPDETDHPPQEEQRESEGIYQPFA